MITNTLYGSLGFIPQFVVTTHHPRPYDAYDYKLPKLPRSYSTEHIEQIATELLTKSIPVMVMTNESPSFTEIKSKQFVLIYSVGLDIPSYEMTAEQIHMTMVIHHEEACLLMMRNSIYDA